VILAGGIYAAVEMDDAVVDGKLVTAPAWPALATWMAKFEEVLVHHMAATSSLIQV
jgi:protease I